MRQMTVGWLALAGLALSASQALAVTCTPVTGFTWIYEPGTPLTAAIINPTTPITTDVDATGCSIGVYYGPGKTGSVTGASIHGANYFGVVNNGAAVDVSNSAIYGIKDPSDDEGELGQRGVGVYFAYGSHASGSIDCNTVWDYQLAGILVSGPYAFAVITNNTVIGWGPTDRIIQTGIQIGYSTGAYVRANTMTGNSYTGEIPGAGAGILAVGGPCYSGPLQTAAQIEANVGTGNDVGVWMANLDESCAPVNTPTFNQAIGNNLTNNGINNVELGGYQAGILDEGDFDSIRNNYICGIGYAAPQTVFFPPPFLLSIDTTYTNNPTVNGNIICPTPQPSSITRVTSSVSRGGSGGGRPRPLAVH